MEFARRNIKFKPDKKISIPYTYEYNVMQSIYYYIAVADSVFEKFLHNEGYRVEDGHIFKLFNFTLRFKNAVFKKEHIELNENGEITLIISGKKDIVKMILKGLLHIKKLKIGDTEIPLKDIEKDKNFKFKEIMFYRGLSPIIESTKDDEGKIVYLSPYESKYYINLANNLKRKYKLIYDEDFKGELFFDIDDALKIKKKSIKVKDFYSIGYIYDIWVETTPKMQKIIYYLGLGQNNSVGAGCLGYVTGRIAENEKVI